MTNQELGYTSGDLNEPEIGYNSDSLQTGFSNICIKGREQGFCCGQDIVWCLAHVNMHFGCMYDAVRNGPLAVEWGYCGTAT